MSPDHNAFDVKLGRHEALILVGARERGVAIGQRAGDRLAQLGNPAVTGERPGLTRQATRRVGVADNMHVV